MYKRRIWLPRAVWAVTLVICAAYYGKFGREAYNLYGDALGYYIYLPATFIYHNNLDIEKLPADKGIRPFIINSVANIGIETPNPKGHRVVQYTYGVALMEAPFFFAAHAVTRAGNGLANGFSQPYRNALLFSTLMYGMLGLWLTYRLLRRRFSKPVSSITTALLLLGTNLFWFVLQQQGMAHVPLFFLFAVLAHLSILTHGRSRWWHFAALGLTAGIITIIRPVDALCLIIPLGYCAGRPFIKSKLHFMLRNWRGVLLAALCFLIPIVPQMLYWHRLTGHFIYDSYGPGQQLHLLHSRLAEGLWGPCNGWLLFTPLMILAVGGMLCYKKLGRFALAAPLLLVLYAWCVYAWYLPNYPNGLGSRVMVDIYAILALPLAAALEWLWRKTPLVRIAGGAMVAVFVALNLSFSVQQVQGIIWSEESKWSFHFATLFRFHISYNDLVTWDIGVPQPDQSQLKIAAPADCASLADSAISGHILRDSSGVKVSRMPEGEEFGGEEVKIRWNAPAKNGARWMRCSGRFYTPEPPVDIWRCHVLVLSVVRAGETILWQGVRINNKIGLAKDTDGSEPGIFRFREGRWGAVHFFAPVPPGMQNGDEVHLSVWNMGRKQIDLADMCIEYYK